MEALCAVVWRLPMSTLAIYNRRVAETMLRTWSTQRLLDEITADRFGANLQTDERQALVRFLHDWVQRALGPLSLRDALLIDPRRGTHVYNLICTALTVARYPLPPAIAHVLKECGDTEITPQQMQAVLEANTAQSEHQRELGATMPYHPSTEANTALHGVLEGAETDGLALAWYDGDVSQYRIPANLEELLPPLPTPYQDPIVQFEQPTGLRRYIAWGLAICGLTLLASSLLMGHMPQQPAGLPLAFLTLALMVGISAGWTGYTGALCIWLVANLPEFHHGTIFLWPSTPLLLSGLVLLFLDRRVRIMWRWIRQFLMKRSNQRR